MKEEKKRGEEREREKEREREDTTTTYNNVGEFKKILKQIYFQKLSEHSKK